MKRGFIMRKILSGIAELLDFVRYEKTPRFYAETMLIFILAAVIFMTGIFFVNEYRAESVNSDITDESTVTGPYEFMQIKYNTTEMKRKKGDIKYIVVHDTANTSKGAGARNHYNFFNTGNRKSSADFFVDSGEIIQVNDYYKYYTWHCGDGGAGAKINNRNSIGVEICINKDGDYVKALESAAELVGGLMKELDIDTDHVVRHYDASGKDCPMTMDNRDWLYFKDRAAGKKYDKNYIVSYAKR